MTGESSKSGLTAGFAASAVLGILMIIKSRLEILPDLDPIRDIVAIAGRYTGLQFPPDLGWVGHFFIGTIVWGLVYAWLRKSLPGGAIVKGLVFGVLAWFAMMLVFMPLAGHGFFGLELGWMAPAATLVLHLIYGAVLAAVYASIGSAAAIDDINPA